MMTDDSCRRIRVDRRQDTWRTFAYSLVKNRRAGDRRADFDDAPAYVDIHGPKIFFGATLLMLFCVLDAFFTLELMQHGSTELNPFLALMLEKDVAWFFVSKYLITAFCVFWLVMHKKFTFFGIKGRKLLSIAIMLYGILIAYQVSMLATLP
jgi:hypothetical protein